MATARETGAVFRAMRGRVDGLVVLSPDDVRTRRLRASIPDSLPVVLLDSPSEEAGPFDLIHIDNSRGAPQMVAPPPFPRPPPDRFHPGARAKRRRGRPARAASGRRSGGSGCRSRRSSSFLATSARTGASGLASALQVWPGLRRPSSRPTTRWRSAASPRCGPGAAPCPGTSRSRASTTSRSRSFTAPPLTTVRVSIAELGAAAAERVLHGVRHGNAHKRLHLTLPTTLVVRESTGSAPTNRVRARKVRSKGTRGRRKDA